MAGLSEIVDALQACGLERIPPVTLVTRWHALLAGDTPRFQDAVCESGDEVDGTRYTFLALTDTALCYLTADHEDTWWEYDRHDRNPRLEKVTPRSVTAWRQPITSIGSIGLSPEPRDWLPPSNAPGEAPTPHYILDLDTGTIDLPLRTARRRTNTPDASAAISQLTAVWSRQAAVTRVSSQNA